MDMETVFAGALMVVLFGWFAVVVVAALLDCIRTPSERVRFVPKLIWLYFMFQAPLFGALAWSYFGKRPERPELTGPGGGAPGTIANTTKGPIHRTEPFTSQR